GIQRLPRDEHGDDRGFAGYAARGITESCRVADYAAWMLRTLVVAGLTPLSTRHNLACRTSKCGTYDHIIH
ncbi:MAG TPA: hypothetical protein P5525_17795, partial [Candidatus Paceibacterota bacterium]|nr:hypothetical protein [Candidatus Paceibacterota bacterium]